MGDTKEVKFFRGLKIARIATAALTGLFFFVALFQIVIFNNIKISFQTGIDAQQLSTIKIKKGSDVELPTPLKPGAYFVGWSLSPTSGEVLENSSALMQDTTLYAVWDGAEKYAVLSVNGLTYKEVNIFDTSVEGLTPAQLYQDWRVLDDYATDNPNLANPSNKVNIGYNKTVTVDMNNNFSRFLGWQYLNSYGQYNDLLYEVDANGTGGTWTWVQRDAEGKETRMVISDTNKFYPPNYRTTFTALLDYRMLNIEIYDQKENNPYDSLSVKLGAEHITLPTYKQQSDAHFSHWEIQVGTLKNQLGYETKQPELAAALKQIKKRYEAGEVLDTLDPLWYYLGSKLTSYDGSADLVAPLTLRAIYWDDKTVYHYEVQPYTDLDSGTTYNNFADVDYNELSLENPVAYDREDNCLWLYFDKDNQILSYTFYDHDGVPHEFTNANLKATTGISIGQPVTVLGEKIYFKDEWGICITVNYQTSAADIMVQFNYGEDLYLLPNYRHYQSPSIATYLGKIGNEFVLLTGENYMKYDYIFTGWQLVGDDSGRLYCAGETFTIPNFDTNNQAPIIEFVAVWHLQRLLFNFDFNGGGWETEEGPDFTLMKGACGNRVKIVDDIPVKFGYDFIGWTLEVNPCENENELNETELWYPGEHINVGTKIQTLYAQWKPRQLHVQYFTKNDATDQWYPATRPVYVDVTGKTLCSGGYVELPFISSNKWYNFNGWQIGSNVWDWYDPAHQDHRLQLTTEVLSQLDAVTREQDDGTKILEVSIYAAQTKCTVNVLYDFTFETSDNTNVEINVDRSKTQTILTQGDLFYDYYPFSVARDNGSYGAFDTAGRQFISWSYRAYTDDRKIDNESAEMLPIESDTRIPAGYKTMFIYGNLSEVKTITVEYYNFAGVRFQIDSQTYNYEATVDLISRNNLGTLPSEDKRLGTFVGWALEPDDVEGNPEIIYDVFYSNNPRLKLSDRVDTASSPYLVDIDHYAVQTVGLNYTLKLYAVYATNFATITYDYLADVNNPGKNNTELKCPVYINGQYDQTVLGGSTVGYDSPDFTEYGMVVLDDSTLQMYSGSNFVGWRAILPDGVNRTVKEYFEKKIWFPGEYLPSIDFDFEFEPIRVKHSGSLQEYKVGNDTVGYRTYNILSLSSAEVKIPPINGSVDVVALPRAWSDSGYTVQQGYLVINSDREVHVVVPAYSKITLEPRAIQCDTIKEFYVGENLIVTGSPVVGANFQAYRICKGYRLMNSVGQPTSILHTSEKYDFESTLMGLLVSRDRKTLYGVPSHTSVSTDELLALLQDNQMNRIAGYALSDINNLSTINLAKNQDLQIDANAIFNGTVAHIILPANDDAGMNLQVSSQAVSGALRNLTWVTFGDETTTKTRYAFVDNGFVYYIDNYLAAPNAKTHVMYVLPSARLNELDYTKRNLSLEKTVTQVEPYALAGRDWTQINSVMVENKDVDLRNLQGIPSNIPLFTTADNPNKGPMIQPYEKTFVFTCNNSESGHTREEVKFKYGQTFIVFNAQKKNYNFYFTKTWSQFVGWMFNGKMFHAGEVYKVGISDEIIGDKYTMQFDASSSSSWTEYPVRFYIYNGQEEKPYTPEVFYDSNGNDYVMDELLTYYNYLDDIYLPGLDQGFNTADGSRYQFIGWVSSNYRPNPNGLHLWNSAQLESRILPNRTANTELNCGYPVRVNGINVYTYYALYEKVTPNLTYELLGDDTFSVSNSTYVNMTSLNIPFAKYHESDKYPGGYMLPISQIGNFSDIGNTLTEISIGGAVSEIGKDAFSNVNAKKVTFNQQGRGIYYNYRQDTPVRQLTIGPSAFAKNTTIQELTLPASLETLDDYAFQTCINLIEVTFEAGYEPALRYLGDKVFCNDYSMTDNAVVRLLTEDGKNGDNRFVKVGAGIFMNTNITDVRTSDGKQTNKIVWRDTLLHVFYLNGYDKDLTFEEKEIAGYAFANLGSDEDDTVKITIRFANPDAVIRAYAFRNLHPSVNKIYLYDRQSLKPANVDRNAFDKSVTHTVDVYTSNLNTWQSAGFGNIGGFRFSR